MDTAFLFPTSLIPGAHGNTFGQVNRKKATVGDFSTDSRLPISHTLLHRFEIYLLKSETTCFSCCRRQKFLNW